MDHRHHEHEAREHVERGWRVHDDGFSGWDRETIDSRREGTRGWGVQGEFRRPKAEDV
jgi:hypothetical protein